MRLKVAIDKVSKVYPQIGKEAIEDIVTFSYNAGYEVGKDDEYYKNNYYHTHGTSAFYNDCVDNEKYPLDENYNVILYKNKDFSIVLTEDGAFKITGYGNKTYRVVLLQQRDVTSVSEWKLDFNKDDETFCEDDECEYEWSNSLQKTRVIADGKVYLHRWLQNGEEEYVAKDGGILRPANLYYENGSKKIEKFRVGFVKVK